jgi:2-oxoglutarate-Fe(II)-dependent dioxygenase family protein
LPEVSASLKNIGSTTEQWVRENREFSQLCGGLLAIVHSELYSACLDVYDKFYEDPETFIRNPDAFRDSMESWGNPFGGLALICNRETPEHRDNNSRYYWYDILATIGKYCGLDIYIPGTGWRFSYESGTLVALGGRALTHAVKEANGERICFAYFVRDKVHQHAGKMTGSWPVMEEILTRRTED